MDEKIKILLNSEKNINSVNVDTFSKLPLKNNVSKFNEYNVRNVLSVNDLFELEREENEIYRVYGGLEYISQLNELKNDYAVIGDFFKPQKNDSKNIFNSFDFYLVRPSDDEYFNVVGLDRNVEENTDVVILNETFNNWVGGVPVDWNYIQGVGGNIEEIVGGGLKINLADNPFLNLVFLNRMIPELTGEVTVRVSVDVTPELNVGTDSLTITFENIDNGVMSFVNSTNVLETSTGIIEYTFNIPSNTPVTRISIWANSFDKSIIVNSLNITQTNFGDVLYGLNNIPVDFNTSIYRRSFKILTKIENFELFSAGFSKNIYDEEKYIYQINKDIDVSEYVDGLGMPLTDLFIFAQYKPTDNEKMTFEHWSIAGDVNNIMFFPKSYNIGDTVSSDIDIIIGDLVEFSERRFFQRQDTEQTFRIETPINNGTERIVWRYTPFIPLKLRYFEDYLNVINKNSVYYDDVSSIPEYAYELNNGDMVWRDIMPEGYTDALTNIGTNHPFVNKKRYLFTNVVLSIVPDLNDDETRELFTDIWFDRKITSLNFKPQSDINEINKPCI